MCNGEGLPCGCSGGPCTQVFDECGSVINGCFPCCVLGSCTHATSQADCQSQYGTWYGTYLTAGFSCVGSEGEGTLNPAPGDGTDCNNDGIPDDCEEVYTAGLEEGILLGGQSGDANGDGTLDVLDIVYFIDVILNP